MADENSKNVEELREKINEYKEQLKKNMEALTKVKQEHERGRSAMENIEQLMQRDFTKPEDREQIIQGLEKEKEGLKDFEVATIQTLIDSFKRKDTQQVTEMKDEKKP